MFVQAHRVKTKPISIIPYQQNIFVTGIYFTGGFIQAHLCIPPRDQHYQRSQMKADRGHLHKGSPSFVKSPLTAIWALLKLCPVLCPLARPARVCCTAVGTAADTTDMCLLGEFSLVLHHPALQCFISSLRKWEDLHHLESTWVWPHTAELCSEQ